MEPRGLACELMDLHASHCVNGVILYLWCYSVFMVHIFFIVYSVLMMYCLHGIIRYRSDIFQYFSKSLTFFMTRKLSYERYSPSYSYIVREIDRYLSIYHYIYVEIEKEINRQIDKY